MIELSLYYIGKCNLNRRGCFQKQTILNSNKCNNIKSKHKLYIHKTINLSYISRRLSHTRLPQWTTFKLSKCNRTLCMEELCLVQLNLTLLIRQLPQGNLKLMLNHFKLSLFPWKPIRTSIKWNLKSKVCSSSFLHISPELFLS